VITLWRRKPTSSELGRLASAAEVVLVDEWYRAMMLKALKQPEFGPKSLPHFLRHD
jgi:hypothetical protein